MQKPIPLSSTRCCKLLLLFCTIHLVVHSTLAQTDKKIFRPTTGLKNVLSAASTENKTALVYLTAKWCGPCRQFEEDALKDSNILQTLQSRFFIVKWDIDSLSEAKDLQLKYHTGVPAYFAFDKTGSLQYYFTGFSDKKSFSQSIGYMLNPESDPVYIMRKRYLQGNNIDNRFLLSYAWALEKNRERETSTEIFHELWMNADTKTKLTDSVALFLLYHTDPREEQYANAVKENLEAYKQLVSPEAVTHFLTSPLQVCLDSIIDKKRDTTGFKKTWSTYRQQLVQLKADTSLIQYASLYPLQFDIIYVPNNANIQVEKAFTSKLAGNKQDLYQFVTYLFLWYKKDNYQALRKMNPQLINWIRSAIGVEDRYLYNYFLAELYYELNDKPAASKYINLAIEKSRQEYPNKKPIASLALQEKINAL